MTWAGSSGLVAQATALAAWTLVCGGALYTFVTAQSAVWVLLGLVGALDAAWMVRARWLALLAAIEADGRKVE